MTWNPDHTARRGYASGIAILTLGVLAFLLTALVSRVSHQYVNARIAELASRADLILVSARDWSVMHSEELRAAGVQELPIDDLLPETHTGLLTIRYDEISQERPVITCDLMLHYGSYSVSRHVSWPTSSGN